jgi:hypothetical protein
MPFGLILSSTPRGEAICPARIASHYHPAWRPPARQLREIRIAQFRSLSEIEFGEQRIKPLRRI